MIRAMQIRGFRWTRIVVLAALIGVGASTIVWSQAAQSNPAPAQPDPANFTGRVSANPTADIRPTRYTFDAAARTNWHSHAGGQVIIVEQGRLRVQERGKPGREFNPRDTYSVAAGVVHWHGARPEAPLTQVAISFGTTTWLEKVSDDQYAAATPK
jgi:quercetin dioxygenase-like cupin family protein